MALHFVLWAFSLVIIPVTSQNLVTGVNGWYEWNTESGFANSMEVFSVGGFLPLFLL